MRDGRAYAVRLDEVRWSAGIRERPKRGGRVAEDLGDKRPDGREGNRCVRNRGNRLAERSSEVLAERAVIGMDPCALGPAVRLDVRGRIWTVACRLELRIGQRRGGRSGELDQRDNQRQEPQMQFAQSHESDGKPDWANCQPPTTGGVAYWDFDACSAL
jgi:hypothetical protein